MKTSFSKQKAKTNIRKNPFNDFFLNIYQASVVFFVKRIQISTKYLWCQNIPPFLDIFFAKCQPASFTAIVPYLLIWSYKLLHQSQADKKP